MVNRKIKRKVILRKRLRKHDIKRKRDKSEELTPAEKLQNVMMDIYSHGGHAERTHKMRIGKNKDPYYLAQERIRKHIEGNSDAI